MAAAFFIRLRLDRLSSFQLLAVLDGSPALLGERRRSPTSARRCVAPAAVPIRASRCAGRSSWRAAVAFARAREDGLRRAHGDRRARPPLHPDRRRVAHAEPTESGGARGGRHDEPRDRAGTVLDGEKIESHLAAAYDTLGIRSRH